MGTDSWDPEVQVRDRALLSQGSSGSLENDSC